MSRDPEISLLLESAETVCKLSRGSVLPSDFLCPVFPIELDGNARTVDEGRATLARIELGRIPHCL